MARYHIVIIIWAAAWSLCSSGVYAVLWTVFVVAKYVDFKLRAGNKVRIHQLSICHWTFQFLSFIGRLD